MMVHFNFMMYENIELPPMRYAPVDIDYTQGTDDDMGGNAYRYNKKSQMTIKPSNLLEINQMKMFNHSHSINNDSFGMSQGND